MRRSPVLAAALATLAAPAAFANSNAGKKLFVCATAQQADLDATAFAALNWVEVKGVGNLGETGSSTNILTYDTWGDKVVQKAKGLTNAGDPTLECARIPTDPGQIILNTAAKTNLNYAIKVEGNDKPDADPDSKPTIRYNRGLITGPTQPNGRNEDFDLDVFTFGLNQEQVTVDPVSGT